MRDRSALKASERGSAVDAAEYYAREEVRSEVAEFCRGRWAALEGLQAGERRLFLRYWDNRRSRPLTLSGPEDVLKALRRFFWARPRAFYASANIYAGLEDALGLEEPSNIVASTPIWDIDGDPDMPQGTLKAASVIVEALKAQRISRSVYLLWSGRGLHVRVHEGALSPRLRERHNPLDLAYALVQHTLMSCSEGLREALARHPEVKVENLMDIKRVFTAPLSLHRQLDRACICFRPDALFSFELSWTNPSSPRHDAGWKGFSEGEADEAASRALEKVHGYFAAPSVKASIGGERTGHGTPATGRPGRFQVMALLQAARYFLLFGDLDKAKSFGLNRAIFYAWAKRGGARLRARGVAPGPAAKAQEEGQVARIGDEVAFLSREGWFQIGGQVQLPSDYDREVARRIEAIMPYDEAWRRALEYLKGFDRQVLESQRLFFERAYAPVRDAFWER